MKFDLHLHSYFSDGGCSPKEVVEKCKNLGLAVISLTDHENAGGIPEAIETGKKLGVRVVPGIEFAVDYRGEEHHILGYFIDYQSEELRKFTDKWQKTKVSQIKKILKNLRKLGFEVSFEDVVAQTHGSIGRSHVARAAFHNPQKIAENSEALKRWKIKRQRDFFVKFILEVPQGEGLAFVGRKKPKIQEVINLIHSLGGMAFWAHPFFRIKDFPTIKERAQVFQKMGLDGIETCYSYFDRKQTLFLHQIAQDLSFYESGGSDFHGEGNAIRSIGNIRTYGMTLNFPFEPE